MYDEEGTITSGINGVKYLEKFLDKHNNENKERPRHLFSKGNLDQQEDLTLCYSSFFDFAKLYPSVIIQGSWSLPSKRYDKNDYGDLIDEVTDEQVNN